ncbi:FGGY-family carbohydrate kinase [Pararhizobium sp. IMCC21322]|uniref:FGGY-family carbohydrate kinase n=1 Tax=Pararhizobium sp. IMCC21322 TaxID=3067903 RepID=UPI0027420086|nr:FGGY-family carbohydrate kinase [Pararhizobium sp. IMCC21322]
MERIVISGSAGRSGVIRQLLADTTGVAIVAPDTEQPALLGSANLGKALLASAVTPLGKTRCASSTI